MRKSPNDPPPRAHRFDASLSAVLLSDGRECDCTAENFSRSGLLLKKRGASWPDAAEMALLLKSVGGDLQVSIQVRVVRRLPATEGDLSFLAVEFTEQDEEKRDGIELLLQRVIEGYSFAPEIPEIPPGTPPHEIRKTLDAVPLTHRTRLASKGSPPEREVLLHDHHPQVLDALARNSGLLAHEARTLATSLHLSPSTLTVLAADGRWSGDPELRILLVSHARVPVPLAEKLITGLPSTALRRALQKSSLNPLVRAAILRRLAHSPS